MNRVLVDDREDGTSFVTLCLWSGEIGEPGVVIVAFDDTTAEVVDVLDAGDLGLADTVVIVRSIQVMRSELLILPVE